MQSEGDPPDAGAALNATTPSAFETCLKIRGLGVDTAGTHDALCSVLRAASGRMRGGAPSAGSGESAERTEGRSNAALEAGSRSNGLVKAVKESERDDDPETATLSIPGDTQADVRPSASETESVPSEQQEVSTVVSSSPALWSLEFAYAELERVLEALETAVSGLTFVVGAVASLGAQPEASALWWVVVGCEISVSSSRQVGSRKMAVLPSVASSVVEVHGGHALSCRVATLITQQLRSSRHRPPAIRFWSRGGVTRMSWLLCILLPRQVFFLHVPTRPVRPSFLSRDIASAGCRLPAPHQDGWVIMGVDIVALSATIHAKVNTRKGLETGFHWLCWNKRLPLARCDLLGNAGCPGSCPHRRYSLSPSFVHLCRRKLETYC